MSTDPRIPVSVGDLAAMTPGQAVLIEGDVRVEEKIPVARFRLMAFSGHPIGCACCAPRGPVAEALGRLFLARARGEIGFFGSVLAVPATTTGRTAIQDALDRDPLVRARYRLAT